VVLDRSSGATMRDFEVVGEEGRMGELADSLGIEILRTLGRGRAIGAMRQATIGARSLSALKAFLRGEQFYRGGHWDSALAHYDQAVAQDPDFALALRRMAQVVDWNPPTRRSYRPAAEYLGRAVALNRGLAPRDSLLLLAESFKLAADVAADPDALVRNLYGTIEVLEEAARRHPGDPDVWFELGEVRFHWAPLVGMPPGHALAALDRAIALDPGFSPAYEHTVELALQVGSARAAEYARTGGALASGYQASHLRLAALVLDSGASAQTVARALSAASAEALVRIGNDHLAWATDSGEATVVVLRELLRGGHEVEPGAFPMLTDPLLHARQVGWALAFRGRVRAAAGLGTASHVKGFGRTVDPFLELALFGAVPDSLARRVFNGALAPDANWGWLPDPTPPRHLSEAATSTPRRPPTSRSPAAIPCAPPSSCRRFPTRSAS
jgi:serine/threonine-protein kinase